MAIGKCTVVFRGISLIWGGGEKLRGRVTWEDLFMEEFVMGEENSNEGAQDFLALFKKKEKKQI